MTTENIEGQKRNLAAEQAPQEAETRGARLERLRAKTNELFPGPELQVLRDRIERSFNVPQWGDYHNEGVLMDRHLDAIYDALASIREGRFPDAMPQDVRAVFQETVVTHADALERYVLLHDISKADLLRLQFEPAGGETKGKMWEGNLEQFATEFGVSDAVRTDPSALAAWMTGKVKSVSYYHQGIDMPTVGRKTESSMHGEAGAETLRGMGYEGVAPAVLTAIQHHEVAYQFSKIKPDTYEKYFTSMTPEERGLALVASYIDTVGSIGHNGKPDLSNFSNLLVSKANAETIAALQAKAVDVQGLDTKKVEAFFLALRKQESVLGDVASLFERFTKECRLSSYDLEVLQANLNEAVSKNELTKADAEKIHQMIAAGQAKDVGRTFGKLMKVINPILKISEK